MHHRSGGAQLNYLLDRKERHKNRVQRRSHRISLLLCLKLLSLSQVSLHSNQATTFKISISILLPIIMSSLWGNKNFRALSGSSDSFKTSLSSNTIPKYFTPYEDKNIASSIRSCRRPSSHLPCSNFHETGVPQH
jgi:hypothetical protein